jgi:hypothetical protein
MIYAASVVIIRDNEIDHHIFTFSLRPGAETTPEQAASEQARLLCPRECECDLQIKIMPVDFNKHLEQYIASEMKG